MDPTTTRTRRAARWAALALFGALSLVAAACGDDEDGGDEAASGTEPASGSEATGTDTAEGGEGGEDFCTSMEELDEIFSSVEEPSPEEQQAVMDRLNGADPPAELEESWNTMLEALGQVFQNPADTAPLATDEAVAAGEEIEAYLQEECGIE